MTLSFENIKTYLEQTQITASLIKKINVPWEHCEWSKTYRFSLSNNDILFVKGTPRNRNEYYYHQFVYNNSPKYIPKIIFNDLDPSSDWHWFILEDAGQTCEQISSEMAIKASYALGEINYLCSKTLNIPNNMPIILANSLFDNIIYSIKQGKTIAGNNDDLVELNYIESIIFNSIEYFTGLSRSLSLLPPSIVHGFVPLKAIVVFDT